MKSVDKMTRAELTKELRSNGMSDVQMSLANVPWLRAALKARREKVS